MLSYGIIINYDDNVDICGAERSYLFLLFFFRGYEPTLTPAKCADLMLLVVSRQ